MKGVRWPPVKQGGVALRRALRAGAPGRGPVLSADMLSVESAADGSLDTKTAANIHSHEIWISNTRIL